MEASIGNDSFPSCALQQSIDDLRGSPFLEWLLGFTFFDHFCAMNKLHLWLTLRVKFISYCRWYISRLTNQGQRHTQAGIHTREGSLSTVLTWTDNLPHIKNFLKSADAVLAWSVRSPGCPAPTATRPMATFLCIDSAIARTLFTCIIHTAEFYPININDEVWVQKKIVTAKVTGGKWSFSRFMEWTIDLLREKFQKERLAFGQKW